MIVGDFNGMVDNELDRSIKTNKNKNKKGNGRLPNTFFDLMEHENLMDIWRKRN